VTAQQLDELRGAAEGIGDDRSGSERERGVDPALPHGDQMGSGREAARVSRGEAAHGALIGLLGEPQRHRASPLERVGAVGLPVLVCAPHGPEVWS
jgi:hypothetical protein